MKINFLIVLVFINISLPGLAQKANYREFSYISDYSLIKYNDTINPYYISINPITNREYITYLCWLSDVYSRYPKVLLTAFPGLSQKTIDSLLIKRFRTDQIDLLVNKTNKYITNYLFNPKYIDYPVIGVNWVQAMIFCKWLSDRYNEALLIKKNIYLFDPNQKGSECFTTEAYLAWEYAGIVKNDFVDPITKQVRRVNWEDHLFYPAFRLPSKYELELVNGAVKKGFVSYKQNNFLNYWADYYITLSKNKMILRVRHDKTVAIEVLLNNTIQLFPAIHKEYCLDLNITNVIDIFKEYNQKITLPKQPSKTFIKDSLGQMSYVLIGEDKYSNPIYINKMKYDGIQSKSVDSIGVFTTFRFAVNAVKK